MPPSHDRGSELKLKGKDFFWKPRRDLFNLCLDILNGGQGVLPIPDDYDSTGDLGPLLVEGRVGCLVLRIVEEEVHDVVRGSDIGRKEGVVEIVEGDGEKVVLPGRCGPVDHLEGPEAGVPQCIGAHRARAGQP